MKCQKSIHIFWNNAQSFSEICAHTCTFQENEALRFSPQNYDHFEDKKKLSFLLKLYVKRKRKDIY